MIKLLTAVFLMLTAPMFSQTHSIPRESVLIGPGDKLHIQVYDTPEMDQHARVEDNGDSPVLFLGEVSLAGMTPDAAAHTVQSLLIRKNLMQHPQVSISIEDYGTQDVSVGGQVNHPGSYMIATPRSILDVLDLAGGLTDFADRHIVIQHPDPHSKPETYFVSNDPTTALSSSVMVRPGDKVIVPRVGLVYVLGDVGRPGGYPLSGNDAQTTLLQSLAMSGSPNKTASISRIHLMRKTESGYVNVPIDMAKIKSGKVPDPVLLADDVVTVPFSFAKNFLVNGTSVASSVGSAVVYTAH